MLGNNSYIGDHVHIGDNVRIGNNVVIEDNSYIDDDVIIRDNVSIGPHSYIGTRSILGEYLADFYDDYTNKRHPLTIGEDAVIRSEAIIYGDTDIGAGFQTGHRVTIRENAKIGNHVRIGTLSDIQGFCQIGDYVNMHSNVHIGQKSIIKDYVWIFPYVVLTNDPNPPSTILHGVTVDEFAIIATSSTILPGIHIGKDSLVGAGSTVTKDVPEMRVFVGTPAKDVGCVTRIIDKTTGKQVYPWRFSFDRGMPWIGIGYDKWAMDNQEGK